MFSTALQLPFDWVDYIYSNPIVFALLILFTSGYVFLAITGRTPLKDKIGADEKTLIGIALGGGFEVMFLILLSALNTAVPFTETGNSLFYFSVGATFLVLVVLPLTLHAGRKPETFIRRSVASVVSVLFYLSIALSAFISWTLLLEYTTFAPLEIRAFVLPPLMSLVEIWFISTYVTGLVYYVYLNAYHRRLPVFLISDRYGPSHGHPRDSRLKPLYGKYKGVTIAVIGILVASSLTVANSQEILFTPQVTYGPSVDVLHTLSMKEPGAITQYFVNITADSIYPYQNRSQNCAITYYEEMNQNVTVRVPSSPIFSSNSIEIPDPSKLSTTGTAVTHAQTTNTYLSMPGPVWQYFGVNTSQGISVSFNKTGLKVSHVTLRFPNLTRGSEFRISLAYFQLAYPPVTCSESVSVTRINSTTVSVRHDFSFANKGDTSLSLNLIEFGDMNDLTPKGLVDYIVNSTSGPNPLPTEIYYPYLVQPFLYIQPANSLIYSVTWTASFQE